MPDSRNHSPAAWQTLFFAVSADFTELSPLLLRLEPFRGIGACSRPRPETSVCRERLLDSAWTSCGGVHRSSAGELNGSPARDRPLAHKTRLRCLPPPPFPSSREFAPQPWAGQIGTPDAQPRWCQPPKNKATPEHSR